MEKLAESHPHYFLKVNDAWIAKIHNINGPNFKDIDQVLDPQVSGHFETRHTILQDEILELVKTNNPYFNRGDRRRLFPGPMAATLSRKHTKFVQDNKYYITEKSDGVRAMFYCRFIPKFPRWQARIDANKRQEFSVTENAILDCITTRIRQKKRDLHPFEFFDRKSGSQVQANVIQKKDPSGRGGSFVLKIKSSPNQSQQAQRNLQFPLMRREGLFICYLFDRTFQFYVLRESGYVFPTCNFPRLIQANPKSDVRIQRKILLDGEIVPCIPHNGRLNYATFDIICYGEKEICVNDKGMDEKIRFIKHVIESHHFYYRHYRLRLPSALTLVCKHFYKKREIRDVLRCIEYVKGKGYLYKRYNKNDGLVFTPIEAQYYHFKPGPCYKLLKWKWPEKNTSDFMIKICNDRSTSSSSRSERIELHYGVSKKSKKTSLYETLSELEGLNEDVRERVNRFGFSIVELFFRRETRKWELCCMREDKIFPNTFLSICSILASQIEDVSKEELVDLVLDSERGKNIDDELEDIVRKNDEFIHLELSFTKQNRKNPVLIVNHGSHLDKTVFTVMKDCVYSPKNAKDEDEDEGEQEEEEKRIVLGGTDLVRYVSEEYFHAVTERKMAVFVRAMFLPSSGIYKIVDFKGDPRRCHGRIIMKSMESLCIRSLELRSRKRSREESNDKPKPNIQNVNPFIDHPPQRDQHQGPPPPPPNHRSSDTSTSSSSSSSTTTGQQRPVIRSNDGIGSNEEVIDERGLENDFDDFDSEPPVKKRKLD